VNATAAAVVSTVMFSDGSSAPLTNVVTPNVRVRSVKGALGAATTIGTPHPLKAHVAAEAVVIV